MSDVKRPAGAPDGDPEAPTEAEVAQVITDLLESDDPVVVEFLWG